MKRYEPRFNDTICMKRMKRAYRDTGETLGLEVKRTLKRSYQKAPVSFHSPPCKGEMKRSPLGLDGT